MGTRSEAAAISEPGHSGFLLKPLKRANLFRAINDALAAKISLVEKIKNEEISLCPEKEPNQIKVLLAEDHPVNQRVAKIMLERAGCAVDTAEDGQKAVEAALVSTYQIIFMDIQMPIIDGFEATKAIRDHEKAAGGHRCIVAMTAHAMSEDKEKCLQAGMDDYLSKPIKEGEIRSIIQKWTIRANGKADTGMTDADNSGTNADPVNIASALERFGGDQELLLEVLKDFLEKTAGQMDNLAEAIDAGNAEIMRCEAHSIKGAAQTLSADLLGEHAYCLERFGKERDLSNAREVFDKLLCEFKRVSAFNSHIRNRQNHPPEV